MDENHFISVWTPMCEPFCLDPYVWTTGTFLCWPFCVNLFVWPFICKTSCMYMRVRVHHLVLTFMFENSCVGLFCFDRPLWAFLRGPSCVGLFVTTFLCGPSCVDLPVWTFLWGPFCEDLPVRMDLPVWTSAWQILFFEGMNIRIYLFVKFIYEWMSEYICSFLLLLNECPNIFVHIKCS